VSPVATLEATRHGPLPVPAGVLRGWTLRHTVLGIAIGLANMAFGPAGGLLLFPAPEASKGYALAMLFHVLMFGLPIVLAVRVADRAVDRGASAPLAYGAAVLLVAIGGSWLGATLGLSRWGGLPASPVRSAWLAVAVTALFGVGVAAYVHWRRARAAMERLHRAEAGRECQRQQLQVQRLLALQAQVEPQVLFDTLNRVLGQVPHDPAAADALLSQLIALLRLMLPGNAAPGPSTVAREHALLATFAAVAGAPAPRLDASADASGAELAPMLLLPLWQLVRADGHASSACLVRVVRAGERLRITCMPDGPPAAGTGHAAPLAADPLALRERLQALHGAAALLQREGAGHWSLEVPYAAIADDGADDGAATT
jgi:hypothetical protein